MNGEKVDMETLSDVAGVPYNFDELDLEMAMITRPTQGPRHAAAVIATSALKNAQWREAFEAKGSTYTKSTAGTSAFKGAPPVDVTSPEMLAWIEDKGKANRPAMSAPVKAFSLIKKASAASAGRFSFEYLAFAFAIAWGLSNIAGVSATSALAPFIGLFNTPFGLFAAFLLTAIAAFRFRATKARVVKKFGPFLSATPLWVAFFTLGRTTPVVIVTFASVAALSSAYLMLKKANKSYWNLCAKTQLPPGVELSPWRKDPASTRFGSSLTDFRAASSSLRLFADRFGIELKVASKSDLVAATVAADAWMLAFNAQYLDQAASYGPDAVTSLGAVIARAAGSGETFPVSEQGTYAKADDINDIHNAIIDWKAWVSEQVDETEVKAVWEKVISDLSNSSVNSLPHMLARTLGFERF